MSARYGYGLLAMLALVAGGAAVAGCGRPLPNGTGIEIQVTGNLSTTIDSFQVTLTPPPALDVSGSDLATYANQGGSALPVVLDAFLPRSASGSFGVMVQAVVGEAVVAEGDATADVTSGSFVVAKVSLHAVASDGGPDATDGPGADVRDQGGTDGTDVAGDRANDAGVDALIDAPVDAPIDGGPDGSGDAGDGAVGPDGPDGSPDLGPCDPMTPFRSIDRVPTFHNGNGISSPFLSVDGYSLYYTRYDTAPEQLYVVVRDRLDAEFDTSIHPEVALTTSQGPLHGRSATLTADGTTIVFASGATGVVDIYRATRLPSAGPTDPFGVPEQVPNINDPDAIDSDPYITPDGQTLFWTSTTGGPWRLWMSVKGGSSNDFQAPLAVAGLGGLPGAPFRPLLTPDQQTLYFVQAVADSDPNQDDPTRIYRATYMPSTQDYENITPVTELWADQTLPVSEQFEATPTFTPDACTAYFTSNRNGAGQELFRATH